jgi:hypothetical protein
MDNKSKNIFKIFQFSTPLAKISVFLILLFLSDFLIGQLLDLYYFKQSSGLLFRTTFAMEKTTDELLIFGSSKANHHYFTDTLEQELGLKCYNAGRDGSGIFNYYAVLRAVLIRYKPKMIILDINPGDFRKNVESYDRLSSILPYYKKHLEIQPIIGLKSPYEKFKMLSGIYPYNSLLITMLIGVTEFNKNRWPDNKGYVPLMKTWNEPLIAESYKREYEIDPNKIIIFESFLRDCLDSKIRLFIVCSPYFINVETLDPSISLAKSIALKHFIPFFDFSNDSLFLKTPSYFADKSHLNDKGAKVFSSILVKKIKEQKDN